MMPHSSVKSTFADRRDRNAAALTNFGSLREPDELGRTIRKGTGPTVFTVGYERRTGDDLIDILRNAGVEILVDVRQRAMSRRADFRGKALRARCEDAGVGYEPMSDLGSTDDLRDSLRANGDTKSFHRAFRRLAEKTMSEPLEALAKMSIEAPVALICYERDHEDCHRATVADLVAKLNDATIVAL